MKVIDLLNKIVNKEINSNVEVRVSENTTYTLDYYLYVMCSEMTGTYKELYNFLNQEVELANVIEDIYKNKKIEKLPIYEYKENEFHCVNYNKVAQTINEIIDYLESQV